MPKSHSKRGEKWTAGEVALARTLDAMAFKDADVLAAGDVLVNLLGSENEKERRLAAERIRDERGLTRIVKPSEQHHLHVSISPDVLALAQQHRPVANSITPQVTRDDGWKPSKGV